jgi:TetR/AcrR family transcriptional repressor of multidrug resistance operon
MQFKNQVKERLIREKAIELLVREGFDGFSMHKLGREAGISSATIYLYFQNKEDLLNNLYWGIERAINRLALSGFEAEVMSLEEGLWNQWMCRYHYIQKYPLHFRFAEQFRNAAQFRSYPPDRSVTGCAFRRAMRTFIHQAMLRGELAKLPADTFWALAYGPFYILVKFHLDKSIKAGKPFFIDQSHLHRTFKRALKSLKP